MALLRFGIGALLLAGLVRRLRQVTGVLWMASALSAVSIAAFFVALQQMDVGPVVAIGAVAPLAALVLERAFGWVRMSAVGVVCVVVAVAGAVMASFPVAGAEVTGVGLAASCISMAAGAVSGVLQARHGVTASAWTRTLATNVAGLVIIAPVALVLGVQASAATWAAAAVAAVGGGGLAVVAQLAALRVLPATMVMTLSAVGLPMLAVSAWLLLGQSATAVQWIGYALVTAASVLLARFPLGRPAAPAAV